MKILYICQRVPYPPDRGDKIASYHAIRHLQTRHDVTVATLADSSEELQNARKLEEKGFRVICVRRSPLVSRLSVLGALLGKTPLSVAHYRSRSLFEALAREAKENEVELVITFCSSMGQYAAVFPATPEIVDFVDLDSQKWDLYARWTAWPKSLIYRLESRRLLAYEKVLARRAALTLVRTEAERRDCERLLDGGRFHVLANGVDLEYFRPREAGGARERGAKLVFTGVMDYFPNVQGVKFFCEKVLPLVERRIPDVSLSIVGSRPSREVLRLAEIPKVEVTGRVPDVRPYLEEAAVVVVPLLLARGIQNKILEAMAMTTPVVATPPAFEGVEAAEGEGVLVGEPPEAFADHVVKLLEDAEFAGDVARRGRRLVEDRYGWDRQLRKLDGLIDSVLGEGSNLSETGSKSKASAARSLQGSTTSSPHGHAP